LIEISELLSGRAANATLLYRFAHHAAYDLITPVLKLCRNNQNRRILVPSTSLLNPKGIFILRAVKVNGESIDHELYIWVGSQSDERCLEDAIHLTKLMINIFSKAETVKIVRQGQDDMNFIRSIVQDGPYGSR
jgi:hypothetical protein